MKLKKGSGFAATYLPGAMAVLLGFAMFLFINTPALAGLAIWFDFESDLTGWRVNSYSSVISDIQQVSEKALVGNYAMRLRVDLRDQAKYDSGEVDIDFEPKDLYGQTIEAWVYVPEGGRGRHPKIANGIHLFVEDTAGNRLYGPWQNLLEGGWFAISLPVTFNSPACGSIDNGFNPRAVKRLGVNIGVGAGGGPSVSFSGPVYIDAISFGTPEQLSSDHFFNFEDPNDHVRLPHWDVDPGWEALAWNELNIKDGALVADAAFGLGTDDDDSPRKGFAHIIYSPYLNLAHKDHHIISMDIRFDPPAVSTENSCPFVANLWVWDENKQKWFKSDDKHIGLGEWTSITLNLDNPAEFAPGIQDYPGDLPTFSDIRQVGIQLYANVPYHGLVMFDNIVIGGREVPNQYRSQNEGFVQVQGTEFVLNKQPFRFVGVNAEYLFTVREADIENIFDTVSRLEPAVVRTWGFSEGCESANANCAAYSRYFQPEQGRWNETAFENFDRLLAMAGQRGIRLIVPLANNWEEYGGIPQYVEWLAEEHPEQIKIPANIKPGTDVYTDTLHDLFFTDPYLRQWYKDYVTTFISRTNRITGIRYADDPTILAWEVINEPRAKSDISGAKIHVWLKEMSDHVRSIDSNHLIGTGAEGWYIMSMPDTQPFSIWQEFPKNYWHFGINWWPECQEEGAWGSNGTDFISDHSSFATTVKWQPYAGPDCESPIQTDQRSGLSNIDYTSVHLYVAEHEANLYRAPYCAWGLIGSLCAKHNHNYYQAEEWLWQHVQDSRTKIKKPLLVAEFGLRKSENYQGLSGKYPQYVPVFTPEERQQLYERYFQTMYNQGVNGLLVWNLGYDRFNDLIWDTGESLENWIPDLNSDAVYLGLNSSPEFVSWGSKSLQVIYDPIKGYGQAVIARMNINQNWNAADQAKIELDLYNAGTATQAAIILVTGNDEYQSIPLPLKPGWNTVSANMLLPYWKCSAQDCSHVNVIESLEDVRQLKIVLYGYVEPGGVYIDYLRHQGNDSLVIYPHEPIFESVAQAWR